MCSSVIHFLVKLALSSILNGVWGILIDFCLLQGYDGNSCHNIIIAVLNYRFCTFMTMCTIWRWRYKRARLQ